MPAEKFAVVFEPRYRYRPKLVSTHCQRVLIIGTGLSDFKCGQREYLSRLLIAVEQSRLHRPASSPRLCVPARVTHSSRPRARSTPVTCSAPQMPGPRRPRCRAARLKLLTRPIRRRRHRRTSASSSRAGARACPTQPHPCAGSPQPRSWHPGDRSCACWLRAAPAG